MQGTVGTSADSSADMTTPAKPQPDRLAAPPPAKDGTPVQSTPGGRTRSVRRPFWLNPLSVRSSFCVVALAIAAPEEPSSCPPPPKAMIQPTLSFGPRPVRPRLCAHLPLVYRSVRTVRAHTRPSRRALCQAWHAPVTSVPSLALRCSRSQAKTAARKILSGPANAPPVPPGAAQVSTPTHPHSNPTGDGEGPCLGRRQRLRLRRGAPSASLRYTNEHFDARTGARMHAPLLTRSHTHTDGHAHTRTVTFRRTHA